jgi:pre-mRNA-processing factor 19
LAIAGTDVRVYHVKQWDLLNTFTDHTALVTGVRFGQNAQTIATCSMDKSLKIFAKD